MKEPVLEEHIEVNVCRTLNVCTETHQTLIYVMFKPLLFIFQQKDTNIETKIAALKRLPLLLSSLGSFSFHLITDIIPGLLSCGEAVQVEIAKVIGSLACVLTENTVIKKLKEQLPFDDPVSSSITFLCPDCDPNFPNKTGNMLVMHSFNFVITWLLLLHWTPYQIALVSTLAWSLHCVLGQNTLHSFLLPERGW